MYIYLPKNDQNIAAMKTVAQHFIIQTLQMPKDQWINTKIERIWQEEREDCEIINITFKSKSDIARVNPNLKNINHESRNKIYQYVPSTLLNQFKGFETAAYRIRSENNNDVNTKIRPGKSDFILIVRKKDDKTPWGLIGQTNVSKDVKARFEVGYLSEEDLIKDIESENRRIESNNLRNDTKNRQKSNRFEFLSNDMEAELAC